jgi:hypothetical protein
MGQNYAICCFSQVCKFTSNSKTTKTMGILMIRIFTPKRDEATGE